MDVELAKTFLEIVNTGSFVRAAERLNVTQTTVSARVRSLESRLGRRLFVRNKAGASLTAAGEQFLGYAPTFVQLWQRACHQVAIPAGRRALLTVGAELSLWNPLLLNWMLRMRDTAPDIALRTDVSVPDELMRQVAAGVLDIAIMYRPQKLPGLRIEELLKEKLVLVTTNGDKRPKGSDYVYVDWGPRFVARHDMSFPDLAHPSLYVNLGPLGLSYIINCGGSGYFRMRTARPYLKAGRLGFGAGCARVLVPRARGLSDRWRCRSVGPGACGTAGRSRERIGRMAHRGKAANHPGERSGGRQRRAPRTEAASRREPRRSETHEAQVTGP